MAYADGELANDVAGAVETAMMSDASLIGRVVAFMRIRRLTKAAAGPLDTQPALQATIDLINRKVAALRGTQPPRRGGLVGRMLAVRWATPALAACLGVIATLVATNEWDHPAPAAQSKPWIPQLSDPALPSVLSTLAMGSERTLSTGVVRAVASYAPKGGELCREFNVTDATGRYDVIACRKAARWTLRFAVDLGGDVGQYKTADGDGPVQNFLTDINAGSPLPTKEEEAALRRLAEDAL